MMTFIISSNHISQQQMAPAAIADAAVVTIAAVVV
jgi:hypothetical protein